MLRMTPLPLLLLAAACGGQEDDTANESGTQSGQQPGIATPIANQTRPEPRPAEAPVNPTIPVESSPQAAREGPVPAAFQGNWTGEADRCGDRAAPLELTIAPDQLIFHESVGMVKAVREAADGRAMIDAAFTGEGQSWQRTLTLRRSGDRLTITNDGTTVTRKRC